MKNARQLQADQNEDQAVQHFCGAGDKIGSPGESFLIDGESDEASIPNCRQRSLIKDVLSATGDTDVAGDSEKSRRRSRSDNSS